MGKSGGGGDEAAKAAIKAAKVADKRIREGTEKGLGFLSDAEAQGLTPLMGFQAPAISGVESALQYGAEFEPRVKEDIARAQEAYMAPAQQQIQAQLGSLIQQAGRGGAQHSGVQSMMGRIGEEMAAKEGQRQLGVEQQVRQQKLGELAGRTSLGMEPLQFLTGNIMGLGEKRANTALGAASQQAQIAQQQGSQLAQIHQQQGAGKGSGLGGAVGAGLNIASSLAGGK